MMLSLGGLEEEVIVLFKKNLTFNLVFTYSQSYEPIKMLDNIYTFYFLLKLKCPF